MPNSSRPATLILAAFALAGAIASGAALAQAYPAKRDAAARAVRTVSTTTAKRPVLAKAARLAAEGTELHRRAS